MYTYKPCEQGRLISSRTSHTFVPDSMDGGQVLLRRSTLFKTPLVITLGEGISNITITFDAPLSSLVIRSLREDKENLNITLVVGGGSNLGAFSSCRCGTFNLFEDTPYSGKTHYHVPADHINIRDREGSCNLVGADVTSLTAKTVTMDLSSWRISCFTPEAVVTVYSRVQRPRAFGSVIGARYVIFKDVSSSLLLPSRNNGAVVIASPLQYDMSTGNTGNRLVLFSDDCTHPELVDSDIVYLGIVQGKPVLYSRDNNSLYTGSVDINQCNEHFARAVHQAMAEKGIPLSNAVIAIRSFFCAVLEPDS